MVKWEKNSSRKGDVKTLSCKISSESCSYPDGPCSHLIWSSCEEVFQLQRCIACFYHFGQNTKDTQTHNPESLSVIIKSDHLHKQIWNTCSSKYPYSVGPHLCVFCSSQYFFFSSSSMSSSLDSKAPLSGITRAPGSWASTHSLIFANLGRTTMKVTISECSKKFTEAARERKEAKLTTCSFFWCNPFLRG